MPRHLVSTCQLAACLQLLAWYKQNGLVAKEKRNGGRKNNIQAHSYEDAKRAVSFISSYAEDNALVLPRRVPGFKQEAAVLRDQDQGVPVLQITYSFDYAQQIHLPSDPMLPGPLYFLVPQEVRHLWGVL